VLPSLAYLALCRSIQLLALLARADTAKDLEILVLRHQLDCAAPPNTEAQAGARRPSAAGRHQPRRAQITLVLLPREARDAVALASTAGRRRLDLPAPPDRTTTAGPAGAAADRPPGQGEPALRLPAHRRRTPAPRRPGLGHHDPHDATSVRAGPRATAGGHDLAGVPAPTGRRDHGVRLLHRRHHLATTVVRAVLHRTGHPAGPPGRGDGLPGWRLGRPAGP